MNQNNGGSHQGVVKSDGMTSKTEGKIFFRVASLPQLVPDQTTLHSHSTDHSNDDSTTFLWIILLPFYSQSTDDSTPILLEILLPAAADSTQSHGYIK